MSKVSALVSAYKAEEFIGGRLLNLYGQAKGIDLEIIIVCVGGGPEDRIASRYDLKIIRTDHIPPLGEAWNMAIEQATGDYLTTANSDDSFYIGGLQRLTEELDRHPELGLVFSQVDLNDGKHTYPWNRLNRSTGEVKDIYDILKERCIIGVMPVWRREIHQQVGYFDESLTVAADYDMWLRMAGAGVRFGYIEDSCGTYSKREDSLENANRDLCRIETKLIRSRI